VGNRLLGHQRTVGAGGQQNSRGYTDRDDGDRRIPPALPYQ
jgi:hypothetical protein